MDTQTWLIRDSASAPEAVRLIRLLEENGYAASQFGAAADADVLKSAAGLILLIGRGLSAEADIDPLLEVANQAGKMVIGIYTGLDVTADDVPKRFEDFGDVLICWELDRILAALRGEKQTWQSPDCSERESDKPKNREECT